MKAELHPPPPRCVGFDVETVGSGRLQVAPQVLEGALAGVFLMLQLWGVSGLPDVQTPSLLGLHQGLGPGHAHLSGQQEAACSPSTHSRIGVVLA